MGRCYLPTASQLTSPFQSLFRPPSPSGEIEKRPRSPVSPGGPPNHCYEPVRGLAPLPTPGYYSKASIASSILLYLRLTTLSGYTVRNGVNAPWGVPQNNSKIAPAGRLQRARGVFQNKNRAEGAPWGVSSVGLVVLSPLVEAQK